LQSQNNIGFRCKVEFQLYNNVINSRRPNFQWIKHFHYSL